MPSASGLLVDRLVWDRRTAQPLSFAVAGRERVYVCGEAASALLLALGGFLPTLSGRVVCQGRDLAGVPTPSRHIAYIPGGDSLIGRRSLLDNVALPDARARAIDTLEQLGLGAAMHCAAASLQPAQRRLVALARALATRPALLLVDEAADDPPAIPERLRALGAAAALVATASPAVALAHADRILLLHAGRTVQFAPPRDVYERPADRWAAEWAGACNLIPAVLDGHGGVAGSVRAWVGGTVLAARFRDRATGPAVLAVRPHCLRVDPDGIPALVEATRFLGAATRVTLRAEAMTLRLDAAEPNGLVPGTPTRVGWNWADAWPVA